MARHIAVFSDVHANLTALNAVLHNIDSRGITDIFCLGDLVDFAPWPNEVITAIRERGIPTVMGNHDERVGFNLAVTALDKHSPQEQRARAAAIAISQREVSADNKQYLRLLPHAIRLELKEGRVVKNLLLVHASPDALDEYIYSGHNEEHLLRFWRERRFDALIMGHTHRAYIRYITRSGDRPLLIANTGATGRMKPGEPLATYLLCHLDGQELTAETVTINYDRAETASAILASEIPDFYAQAFLHHPQRT